VIVREISSVLWDVIAEPRTSTDCVNDNDDDYDDNEYI
jgi:hypothetical protein